MERTQLAVDASFIVIRLVDSVRKRFYVIRVRRLNTRCGELFAFYARIRGIPVSEFVFKPCKGRSFEQIERDNEDNGSDEDDYDKILDDYVEDDAEIGEDDDPYEAYYARDRDFDSALP